ncbi:hypothetical protein pipiens_010486 [Culex pipiens pipiens]|uniref:Uncharacterized protein n=1 Tax=Culex pipiens pipiens TaxID=38569 RepID=A0ABD1DA13_CULPP
MNSTHHELAAPRQLDRVSFGSSCRSPPVAGLLRSCAEADRACCVPKALIRFLWGVADRSRLRKTCEAEHRSDREVSPWVMWPEVVTIGSSSTPKLGEM